MSRSPRRPRGLTQDAQGERCVREGTDCGRTLVDVSPQQASRARDAPQEVVVCTAIRRRLPEHGRSPRPRRSPHLRKLLLVQGGRVDEDGAVAEGWVFTLLPRVEGHKRPLLDVHLLREPPARTAGQVRTEWQGAGRPAGGGGAARPSTAMTVREAQSAAHSV